MNYQQAIDFLYSQLPMFSRMGSAAYKKDLTNTVALCEELGNPHQKFKSIHIGGTNGKGSVSHMLAAVLQQCGYITGLYTSPHLYDFRERIKVNGQMIEEDYVSRFVEKMKQVVEGIEPSFFEITVAMAFDYFAQRKVDVAIIEVGLGGRLDSTNIIHPELSVITNIGWDHMNLLGDSLHAIAAEKAGIIKPSVPIVIGERDAQTEDVFTNVAKEKNAPLYFASDRFIALSPRWNESHLFLPISDKKQNNTSSLQLDLQGIYQTKNICTVLQAIEALRTHTGFILPGEKVQQALANAKKLTGLHGRWEVLRRRPTVVLEVAHNREGMEQMLLHLQQLRYHRLHFVLGMVKDKDVDQALSLFPSNASYYFTQAHIPRALDAELLREKGTAYALEGQSYPDVNTALNNALEQASPDDLIIVCGSIFLVAEVERKDF